MSEAGGEGTARPGAGPAEAGAGALRSALLEFELRALRDASLPRYPGSTLRGAIGGALRDRACVTGAPDCRGCAHVSTCHYGVLWESGGEVSGPRRFSDPPRPYVLDPFHYGTRTRFLPGDRMAFRLRVFGPAIDRVPWLILAVEEAARRGLGRGPSPFELLRVNSFDDQRQPLSLFSEGRIVETARLGIQRLGPIRTRELPEAGRVSLILETPLQLTDGTRMADRVDPVVFSSRLLDRFDALLHFYEQRTSGIDRERVRALASLARVAHHDLGIDAFQRHSRRQGRVPMKGLLGRVTFDHVVPELYGFWKLGEAIHVGKQATFGFGKLRLAVEHLL